MDTGFVKADSLNLPKVDSLMVGNFFSGKNSDFFSAEQKNVKTAKCARESYGDDAVGYVQIKRSGEVCIVKCKLCPEHKTTSKQYTVSVTIDEAQNDVSSAVCNDCPAAAGGCKHSVAFLMWLHRRSEEPACTSIACYWKKSNLSKVGSSIKFITVKDMCKIKYKKVIPDSSVLADFVEYSKQRNIQSCQFMKHCDDFIDTNTVLSLHYLLNQYKDIHSANFLNKIKHIMTPENITNAEKQTRSQSKSGLWFELRYGRITASKCHEVSRCKTVDGSLVATIFGARSVETPAIRRGQRLEDQVREVAEEKLGIKFAKCGLYISQEYPMLAGSPDGYNKEKGLIEIKCPTTDRAFQNYIKIKNGNIAKKFFAQVQMQMFCAKVHKSYFCVASSDFEQSKNVTILPVTYNNDFVQSIIDQVISFWKINIYPRLYESVIM